jgi:hypothetical protein
MWNGTGWTLIPSSNRPPNNYDPQTTEFTDYISSAYDARRDKFVLCGSTRWDGSTRRQAMPVIWEWDATNGWTNPTPTGTPSSTVLTMFFDEMRGTLIVYGPGLFEWDGGPAWR